MAGYMKTIDGNEAAAHVAFQVSDLCIIYPITPSSPMGEFSDQWMAENKKNIWGMTPDVIEMQSEAGAVGAVHGALQTGSLTTTFTASQGLLLMIPNMYKIAGELIPSVFHVTARTVATHALSIFGDHSDVMAVRQTGFAMLASASVQEVMDMALIAHAATLKARLPFVHFFDGFRTSHEVSKIAILDSKTIRAMIDDKLVYAHRERAMSPEHPVLRGTAQNPDVFFQARETANPYYDAAPALVQETMDQFAKLTGRQYHLFDYYGAADADRVIVIMGSGVETAAETAKYLQRQGEKVAVLAVRLYRPFDVAAFLGALPKTLKTLAVLDRTKEPGATGEPLYQDIATACLEAQAAGTLPCPLPRLLCGRYGLSSKEFTPAMVKGIFDEMTKAQPKNHFTVGIVDDVGKTSLAWDPDFDIEPDNCIRALFYGLGADGTVGANKNSIKIIGEETHNYAQGYFVYDSKKSGSQTVSHLRFGPDPIKAPYLVRAASFIGCHQFPFIDKTDMLANAAKGGVFLLNAPFGPDEIWDKLPRKVQEQIIAKQLKFYVIDALKVARDNEMGGRINTIMQTCFFAISNVLPKDDAIKKIKDAIRKSFGKKGEDVVQKNFKAVDNTLANLHLVQVPAQATSQIPMANFIPAGAPEFYAKVTSEIIAGRGDELPVSAFPVDGTFPTATSQYEKRGITDLAPVWDPDTCAQCGKCAMVCPHAVIRMKIVADSELAKAPAGFRSVRRKGKGAQPGTSYVLGISADDCTGCELCVLTCPAKNKTQTGKKAINMASLLETRAQEAEFWKFFQNLPNVLRAEVEVGKPMGVQFLEPLFEFSGACGGCGETPYVKLLTQLFGDRALIANATGCSSIYGGNLPTTPYAVNKDGRGPAWCNSLFEDNAEFGFGFRASVDTQTATAAELVTALSAEIGAELAAALLANLRQSNEKEISEQRQRVAALKAKLAGSSDARAQLLLNIADNLVKRSVWIVGGDGWAYDIGYGGLDHVLASGRNVNILVLDTEVYSNTGGQASKSTPRGAVAKFAAAGKKLGKKDLAMMAMTYGGVYVARVALGADERQTLQAFIEAEAYDGPSLIIAYSHCIAHGINMAKGLDQQDLAVKSGHWPLFRYNPDLATQGENPLQLDSAAPSIKLKDYAYNEVRYRMLAASKPEEAERLLKLGQADVDSRWKLYERLAGKA